MAYAPAGNLTTSAGLTNQIAIYYARKALDQLMKKFRFKSVTMPDSIPLRNGKTVQWYRYSLLAANTTPSAEGTVGTSLPLTTTTVSATVSEYSDFITVSSLLKETAIDPIITSAAEQLSYRAGLSVDTITRTEFDSATATELSTLGAAMTVGDVRRAKALLEGADVLPLEDDNFVMISHPYATYDIQSDNTAGGFIDVMKYADPSRMLTGEVGKISGVRIVHSTNVKTSGTAPNVLYWNYLVGKGAVGSVSLAGVGPSDVVDPTRQNFKINTGPGGPTLADPEGMIGGWVSYRFTYVPKILDSTVYRFKMIKADSTLV